MESSAEGCIENFHCGEVNILRFHPSPPPLRRSEKFFMHDIEKICYDIFSLINKEAEKKGIFLVARQS